MPLRKEVIAAVKESQEKVWAFATRYGLLRAPELHLLDLLAEVGEVAKAILTASDYGQHAPKLSPQLAEELGDAGYALFALACAVEVDLETALEQALAKYEARLKERGDPGSGDRRADGAGHPGRGITEANGGTEGGNRGRGNRPGGR